MNNLPVVRSPWRILILIIGFTFLYAPMLMLVIYSFNSSKLVTVWAGWSTRWYSELFHDDAMMSAVGLSLTIAALAATMACVLGTIAALVMVRFGRFRGANGFAFMITARWSCRTSSPVCRCSCCLSRWRTPSAGQRIAGCSPSGWRTSPSVRRMWRWSSPRGCASWIAPLKRRRWILAPRR